MGNESQYCVFTNEILDLCTKQLKKQSNIEIIWGDLSGLIKL
jgi:hypothetical protein